MFKCCAVLIQTSIPKHFESKFTFLLVFTVQISLPELVKRFRFITLPSSHILISAVCKSKEPKGLHNLVNAYKSSIHSWLCCLSQMNLNNLQFVRSKSTVMLLCCKLPFDCHLYAPIITYFLWLHQHSGNRSSHMFNTKFCTDYSDCAPKTAAPQGLDDEAAKKLWDLSASMVGLA